jgi:hypothetical protein
VIPARFWRGDERISRIPENGNVGNSRVKNSRGGENGVLGVARRGRARRLRGVWVRARAETSGAQQSLRNGGWRFDTQARVEGMLERKASQAWDKSPRSVELTNELRCRTEDYTHHSVIEA